MNGEHTTERLTKQAFQFDVGSYEIIECNVAIFVTVSHHQSIERGIADSQAYKSATHIHSITTLC